MVLCSIQGRGQKQFLGSSWTLTAALLTAALRCRHDPLSADWQMNLSMMKSLVRGHCWEGTNLRLQVFGFHILCRVWNYSLKHSETTNEWSLWGVSFMLCGATVGSRLVQKRVLSRGAAVRLHCCSAEFVAVRSRSL